MPVEGITVIAAGGGATASTPYSTMAGGGGATSQGSGFGDLFDSSALGRNLLMNMETEAIPGQNKRPREDDHDVDQPRTPSRPNRQADSNLVQDTNEYVNKLAEISSYGINLTKQQKDQLLASTGYVRPISTTPQTSTSKVSQPGTQPTVNTRPQRPTAQKRPRLPNWSFIVKSDHRIDELRLLEALGSTVPVDCTIQSTRLAPSGNMMYVKTSIIHNNPAGALNYYLQPRVKTLVENKYGKGPLEVLHYDPTVKSVADSRLTKQAIAKGVPLSADPDWLLTKIKAKGGDFATKVEAVYRITSQATSKPTGLVRIICTDTDMAAGLIKDGISVCGLFFRCEAPNSKPEPKQCFKCQQFHHLSYSCKEPQICGKCSGAHRQDACPITDKANYKCPRCQGNHVSWYKGCPAYVRAAAEMATREAAKKASAPSAQPATAGSVGKVQQAAVLTNKNVIDTSQKVGEVKKLIEEEVAKLKHEVASELDQIRKEMSNFKSEIIDTIKTTIKDSLPSVSPSKHVDQKGLQKQIKSHQSELQKEFAKCMEKGISEIREELTNALERNFRKMHGDRETLINEVQKSTTQWQYAVQEKDIVWNQMVESCQNKIDAFEGDVKKYAAQMAKESSHGNESHDRGGHHEHERGRQQHDLRDKGGGAIRGTRSSSVTSRQRKLDKSRFEKNLNSLQGVGDLSKPDLDRNPPYNSKPNHE